MKQKNECYVQKMLRNSSELVMWGDREIAMSRCRHLGISWDTKIAKLVAENGATAVAKELGLEYETVAALIGGDVS